MKSNGSQSDSALGFDIENLDKLVLFLAQLAQREFFGDVSIRFKNGEIVLITTTESKLPDNL